MAKIEIFEPALCCPTGVCGPSVDPELLRITGLVKASKKFQSRILRRNMSHNPDAFVDHPQVSPLLEEKGVEVLPITLVDGEVFVTGRYPTNEEIVSVSDIRVEESAE